MDADAEYEELPPGSSLSSQLLAGAFAGIAEHTVMFPFDSIKTRMQVLHPSPAAIYNGVIHAFSKISSTEGYLRLWRGILSVALGAGPAHAVYFASFEEAKRLAGAVATTAADALMNPFDVIKQRMQLHGSDFKSIFACTQHIFKNEGLLAFYISYPATLFLNVPFHFVQFSTYEKVRHLLNPQNRYDPVSHVLAGAAAGTTAAAVTTPIDVVKTLLQTKGESSSLQVRQVSSVFDAVKVIYTAEGFSGFLRGWKPRVLTHMPSTAICWTTYEYFKWILSPSSTIGK